MIWFEDSNGLQLCFTDSEHGLILVRIKEWAPLFTETTKQKMKVINLDIIEKPKFQMMLARCEENNIYVTRGKGERFR